MARTGQKSTPNATVLTKASTAIGEASERMAMAMQ